MSDQINSKGGFVKTLIHALIIATLVLCGAALWLGCNTEALAPTSPAPAPSTYGAVMLKIVASANSPFQKLADSAVVEISAADMNTISQNLTISSSGLSGSVEKIPAGSARLFEISVFDSAKTKQYYGSTHVDIVVGKTASVSIAVARLSGGATISGTIDDTTSGTDTSFAKSVAALCLSDNEISGWVKDPDYSTTCKAQPKDELWNIINGGAAYYIDKGMAEFSFFYLANGSKKVEIRTMDFGSDTFARLMYDISRRDATDALAIPGYTTGEAIVDEQGGGTVYQLYGHFRNFYVELTFSGLTDTADVFATVDLFLSTLKNK